MSGERVKLMPYMIDTVTSAVHANHMNREASNERSMKTAMVHGHASKMKIKTDPMIEFSFGLNVPFTYIKQS